MKVLVNSQDKVYLTSGNKALKAKEKCGMTIGDFVGDIDSNGVLNAPAGTVAPDFTGIEDVGQYALYSKFNKPATLSAISFPDLTTISGQYALGRICWDNQNIIDVSLPSLTTVPRRVVVEALF